MTLAANPSPEKCGSKTACDTDAESLAQPKWRSFARGSIGEPFKVRTHEAAWAAGERKTQ